MKKLLLSLTAVFAVSSLMAQYDLEAILETPTEGSSVVASSNTTFSFGVKNNGPSAIPAGDTVWVCYAVGTTIYSLNGQAGYVSALVLPQAFPSGVTLTSAMLGGATTITLNTSSYTSTTPVCAYIVGVNEAIDEDEDPNDTDNANNISCFSVTPAPLSIDENENIATSVYPNPATTVLNITSAEEVSVVNVMTTDGKIVATSNTTNVNIESLNAGMYLYQVTTVSGKVSQGNFIKN
ncbi:hypothetical protein D3C87_34450 [compost metagenome]